MATDGPSIPRPKRSVPWPLVLVIALTSMLVGLCGGGTSVWIIQRAAPTPTADRDGALRLAATIQATDCADARHFLADMERAMEQETPITDAWNEWIDQDDSETRRGAQGGLAQSERAGSDCCGNACSACLPRHTRQASEGNGPVAEVSGPADRGWLRPGIHVR